jgi:hypothetical protein
MSAVTVAVVASGVEQQPLPPGETVSQFPPEEVVAVTVKLMTEPSVAVTVKICGSGFAPPNDFVNASGGIEEKFWASKDVANNGRMTAKTVRMIVLAAGCLLL